MDTYILYIIAFILLGISWYNSRKKTILSLKKAWKAIENILPQLLVVILLVGVLMALLNPATISRYIGAESGLVGVILAALVGSITLIPPVVAMPMAAMLLQNGAGFMQIGAFISTLQMVGIVTLPVEIKYFGRKVALSRNLIAFAFSFVVAGIIGWVVKG